MRKMPQDQRFVCGEWFSYPLKMTHLPFPDRLLGASYWPSLAWTSSEYGLSWHDNRGGNYEIYFARIAATGTKIGADLRITNDPNYSGLPFLVWTGLEYGVIWVETRDGNTE